MLGLPKSTETKKQLPKTAIYAKFNMNTVAQKKFDADISRITIVGEISPVTTNIEKGENISSIFILLVSLKHKEFEDKTIAQISKLINQNMLLVLECDGESKLAIYHNKLIQSDWQQTETCSIKLEGLNLDVVWENIVKGIAFGNEELEISNEQCSLDEQLAQQEKRQKLQKEIARLEKQAKKEKQPKKKFEIVQKINKLKRELEGVL